MGDTPEDFLFEEAWASSGEVNPRSFFVSPRAPGGGPELLFNLHRAPGGDTELLFSLHRAQGGTDSLSNPCRHKGVPPCMREAQRAKVSLPGGMGATFDISSSSLSYIHAVSGLINQNGDCLISDQRLIPYASDSEHVCTVTRY